MEFPHQNMNCNGISIIINGIPSERRVPASCSYNEIGMRFQDPDSCYRRMERE
jgi:hypothetical protein